MAEDKKTSQGELSNWVSQLYEVETISIDELNNWYTNYQYQGFDRNEVLQSLKSKVDDVKICHQIILTCALRGPQRAANTKLLNGRLIQSYGIPASGLKGNKGVSCQRITAATADIAAYFLKTLNAPKRMNVDCPAWLQFPSAGSIKMPSEIRIMHIEFSKRFSIAIGGSFNEQIYDQMTNNAYVNPKFNLFNEKHNELSEPQQIRKRNV